jgi:hypothetical protein
MHRPSREQLSVAENLALRSQFPVRCETSSDQVRRGQCLCLGRKAECKERSAKSKDRDFFFMSFSVSRCTRHVTRLHQPATKLTHTNPPDTRIADSRSTCNHLRTHDNFSTLPLLCQKKLRLKYECGHQRAYESLCTAAKLVAMR